MRMAYVNQIEICDDGGTVIGHLNHETDGCYSFNPIIGMTILADDFRFIARVSESELTKLEVTDETT